MGQDQERVRHREPAFGRLGVMDVWKLYKRTCPICGRVFYSHFGWDICCCNDHDEKLRKQKEEEKNGRV